MKNEYIEQKVKELFIKTRKKSGLNQTDFGARIGFGQSAISKIEAGLCTASVVAYLRLIREFKCRGVKI